MKLFDFLKKPISFKDLGSPEAGKDDEHIIVMKVRRGGIKTKYVLTVSFNNLPLDEADERTIKCSLHKAGTKLLGE